MFLWFLGTATVAVWFVFRDAGFDYRVLFIGAVGVDAVDGALGGARFLHSVTASVLALLMVVVCTRRGGVARRRMLALPIGMFLHLVFDGAFSATRIFWWPAREAAFSILSTEPVGWFDAFDSARLPSVERGALNVALELAGFALLAWMWRLHGLGDARVRREFLREGRLSGMTSKPVGRC